MLNFLLLLVLSQPVSKDINILKRAQIVQSKYNAPNKKYVVIIDYSKPIDSERLYVVDMNNHSIILKSNVSHARKSGYFVPYDFSNKENTKKSSLGTYLTIGTYYGSFGYSLSLKGLDSTNSNAQNRSIIFHSSKLMKSKWSWGCFATPDSVNKKLIDIIKDGCLVSVQVGL
jgi:hypothetical protein